VKVNERVVDEDKDRARNISISLKAIVEVGAIV
jgi:hypothetical protein